MNFLYPMFMLILLVFAFFVVYSIVYQRAKKDVEQNSTALAKVSQLQTKYFFNTIDAEYSHIVTQNSLAAFRRFNYEYELLCYVKDYQLFFKDILKKLHENCINYDKYLEEYNYIIYANKKNWNSNLKNSIEQKLLKEEKIYAVCSIEIKIINSYTSPKGRNSYRDYKLFFENDVVSAFEKIEEQNSFEARRRAERSKMSDSLRYDILKRDDFRCTICGASAKDGVTLHVDHIIPVSKGGKTIHSNLRTLCSNCNLGKRDKYDPYGVN